MMMSSRMVVAIAMAKARRFLTPRLRIALIAPPVNPELVERALAKDQAALARLLDVIIPALYLRIAYVLRRRAAAARGRNVRQELDDIAQDVLLRLFADQGKILRGWDPERGLSLERFVGLVAERHIASQLRSQRRSPWTEDPTMAELLSEHEDAAPNVESRLASRELCELILDRLRARLSPLALHLFYALIVEGRDLEEVAAETKLPKRAMYNWKYRLLRAVQEIADELEQEKGAER